MFDNTNCFDMSASLFVHRSSLSAGGQNTDLHPIQQKQIEGTASLIQENLHRKQQAETPGSQHGLRERVENKEAITGFERMEPQLSPKGEEHPCWCVSVQVSRVPEKYV